MNAIVLVVVVFAVVIFCAHDRLTAKRIIAAAQAAETGLATNDAASVTCICVRKQH